MARLRGEGSGLPDRIEHKRFGDLAAVRDMCQRLGLAEVIDEVVGERRADVAVSVGTYLMSAMRNRIVDQWSKRAFADWWDTTAGPRFVRPRLPGGATDHRRFWDAMDALDVSQSERIEQRLSLGAIDLFDLEASGLVLDRTSLATLIDTANDRAVIARRGNAKQKRHDLRLVGLALVVTCDGAIPIVSHPCPAVRQQVSELGMRNMSLTYENRGIGARLENLRTRQSCCGEPVASIEGSLGSEDNGPFGRSSRRGLQQP